MIVAGVHSMKWAGRLSRVEALNGHSVNSNGQCRGT